MLLAVVHAGRARGQRGALHGQRVAAVGLVGLQRLVGIRERDQFIVEIVAVEEIGQVLFQRRALGDADRRVGEVGDRRRCACEP